MQDAALHPSPAVDLEPVEFKQCLTLSVTSLEHFSILCSPGRRVKVATASWQSLTSPSLSNCCSQSLLYSSSMVALLCFCMARLPLSLD